MAIIAASKLVLLIVCFGMLTSFAGGGSVSLGLAIVSLVILAMFTA